MTARKKEFTQEELREFDGQEDRPIYVAADGKVFDLSESKRWKNGRHMNRHEAGADLTVDLGSAPHGPEVLENFPLVGYLKEEEEAEGEGPAVPAFFQALLDRFPFLQRHPHPMFVHFPIVFSIMAPLFSVLYLITGYGPFEQTTFHLLGGAVLFSITGLLTGFLTWWLNYLARPMPAVIIKIIGSFLLLWIALVLFVWRLLRPEVLTDLGGLGWLYLLALLSMLPLVSFIGYLGAELTFPTHGGRKK